jgi:hypothetical protein
MSSIREELERRRAEGGDLASPLYSTAHRAVGLIVETTAGETWVLSWHHFIFGRHQEAGEHERLVLSFVAHEVELHGLNLRSLITEVVHERLGSLRAAPGRYLKSSGDEPAIEQIHVRPLAEPIGTE